MANDFDKEAIDTEARRLMKRENVQGMALAIIKRGEVSYVAAYGWRNTEREHIGVKSSFLTDPAVSVKNEDLTPWFFY